MHRITACVLAASLLSGCTIGGAVIGGMHANSKPQATAPSSGPVPTDATVLTGAAIGLVVDACLLFLLLDIGGTGPTLVSRQAPEL